jgi:hypothetical protein
MHDLTAEPQRRLDVIRARGRWARIASAVGVAIFVAWVVFFVFALATQPIGCASGGPLEIDDFGVEQVAYFWSPPLLPGGLLVGVGVGYLLVALAATLWRVLDRPSRLMLVATGLLLLVGSVVVTLTLEWLVERDILHRSFATCTMG